MKSKPYLFAIISAMTIALSGCSVIDKASSFKYDVIDIKEITDAEFDLTSYAKNTLNSDMYVEAGRLTKVGEKYVKMTIRYFNKKERNVAVLIFDKKLNLVASVVFDRELYIRDKFKIENSIREVDGVILYPETAKKFVSHVGVAGNPELGYIGREITNVMLSIDGGSYRKINESDLFKSVYDDSEMQQDIAYYTKANYLSSFNKETGYISFNQFYDVGSDCKEDKNPKRLLCPKNKYELKINESSLYISRKKVDFKYSYFASDVSRSIMMRGPVVLGSYKAWRAKIIPITNDGEVNAVFAGHNNLMKKISNSTGININGGAIVFNRVVAGPRTHTFINSNFSEIDTCRHAFTTTENQSGKEKIVVINSCKIKAIK
ncbi:hypothetical protein [Aeromonas veronii]|uniref:Lipoprotein n=1 Tax=Aeromonas veronii TaxID=654 RepID=A0A2T4MWG5_AERVE|nr:hypothetical protein [Aeromonas veronii]PTH78875.1 hypothetical protein DAA48_20755 [Aeromonas veronii]